MTWYSAKVAVVTTVEVEFEVGENEAPGAAVIEAAFDGSAWGSRPDARVVEIHKIDHT